MWCCLLVLTNNNIKNTFWIYFYFMIEKLSYCFASINTTFFNVYKEHIYSSLTFWSGNSGFFKAFSLIESSNLLLSTVQHSQEQITWFLESHDWTVSHGLQPHLICSGFVPVQNTQEMPQAYMTDTSIDIFCILLILIVQATQKNLFLGWNQQNRP